MNFIRYCAAGMPHLLSVPFVKYCNMAPTIWSMMLNIALLTAFLW